MKNFKLKLLQFTHWATSWHYKLFEYKVEFIRKSENNKFFIILLIFICVYEICECIMFPLILLYWGLK